LLSHTYLFIFTFLFNLQRTWEDPTFIHPDAEGCRGDNDPLDVCEIGARIIAPGVSIAVLEEYGDQMNLILL
jgi:inorganic pyrophosphatase